jgi:hypothetical protein
VSGKCYYGGQDVVKDHAEAVRWFRLAVEQGHAGPQYYLGHMFFLGHGVAQDRAEAIRLVPPRRRPANANAAALWLRVEGNYACAELIRLGSVRCAPVKVSCSFYLERRVCQRAALQARFRSRTS